MVSIPNVQEDQYTLAMEFYLDQNGKRVYTFKYHHEETDENGA